ncbi:hypothetical protein [Companilactobacillus zhongbaensis]|uniref:hypothetical protein n=1 Tax=Companilactobacillus zhongbaensis TaxID=2486009 RepID=UPI000F76F794|nr:hypothetical protein [Companilactobacillus zhongbaensis]
MNGNDPDSKKNNAEALSLDQRRAKLVASVVCALSVIFLFIWFLLFKQQYSLMIVLYCVAPLLLYLFLNWAFNFSYARRKD